MVFDKAFPDSCITLRDFIHGFFTNLKRKRRNPKNDHEAYMLLSDSFSETLCEGTRHNFKIDPDNENLKLEIPLALPTANCWTALDLTACNDIPKQHIVLHAVTTHQYLLIASNGALEIHQTLGLLFMKTHYLEYRTNKHRTRIISRPGSDGRNIWYEKALPTSSFEKNEKNGIVEYNYQAPQK